MSISFKKHGNLLSGTAGERVDKLVIEILNIIWHNTDKMSYDKRKKICSHFKRIFNHIDI